MLSARLLDHVADEALDLAEDVGVLHVRDGAEALRELREGRGADLVGEVADVADDLHRCNVTDRLI